MRKNVFATGTRTQLRELTALPQTYYLDFLKGEEWGRESKEGNQKCVKEEGRGKREKDW